jgi:hypothetical protein
VWLLAEAGISISWCDVSPSSSSSSSEEAVVELNPKKRELEVQVEEALTCNVHSAPSTHSSWFFSKMSWMEENTEPPFVLVKALGTR